MRCCGRRIRGGASDGGDSQQSDGRQTTRRPQRRGVETSPTVLRRSRVGRVAGNVQRDRVSRYPKGTSLRRARWARVTAASPNLANGEGEEGGKTRLGASLTLMGSLWSLVNSPRVISSKIQTRTRVIVNEPGGCYPSEAGRPAQQPRLALRHVPPNPPAQTDGLVRSLSCRALATPTTTVPICMSAWWPAAENRGLFQRRQVAGSAAPPPLLLTYLAPHRRWDRDGSDGCGVRATKRRRRSSASATVGRSVGRLVDRSIDRSIFRSIGLDRDVMLRSPRGRAKQTSLSGHAPNVHVPIDVRWQ
jgi:hypothetical protein